MEQNDIDRDWCRRMAAGIAQTIMANGKADIATIVEHKLYGALVSGDRPAVGSANTIQPHPSLNL